MTNSKLHAARIDIFYASQHYDDPHSTITLQSQRSKKAAKLKEDGEFCDSHMDSMSFGEFIEAITTCIIFIFPDPYEPICGKFETYVIETLYKAHQKNLAAANSGK